MLGYNLSGKVKVYRRKWPDLGHQPPNNIARMVSRCTARGPRCWDGAKTRWIEQDMDRG